jgi:TRAP-type C4-dicarboxylate transport system substrate-binding protein
MNQPSRRLMTKTFTVLAGITMLLGGFTSSLAQEVKHAKLGHSFADTHPRALAMKQFATNVEKATGGKLVIDVYGSSTLGGEDKMLIALQSGTQDLYMGAL